ncbi:Disks large like 1 [Dissostichus eleginoides]|uniref:Disks large like 1 n=1 Tax=Dissostichus eleginoides TaxID=100907 RepID=A0AAD9CNW7_DISEL|nr:Disks large like 1 [Dissostichus eleginoides]
MTFWGVDHTMVHKYDTQRAVGLLRHYQANLTNPEEQALKTSVGKVSSILGSQLFHALLDIQECYEVTLQLNTEQTVVKEDSRQDAWEVIFLLHIIDWRKYA